MIVLPLLFLLCGARFVETTTFEWDKPGRFPEGWMAGVTGKGSHHWTVEKDENGPSTRNVLKQSATGDFPWIVKVGAQISDGFVEIKFKPISGKEDQAGGVVWRFKDGNKYYVARANALENNVSIYYTIGGKRNTIKYVDAKDFGGAVTPNQWHVLRVEFQGAGAIVFFDGKKAIEIEDEHISGAGALGLWTKADSVTAFYDFSYGDDNQRPGTRDGK